MADKILQEFINEYKRELLIKKKILLEEEKDKILKPYYSIEMAQKLVRSK